MIDPDIIVIIVRQSEIQPVQRGVENFVDTEVLQFPVREIRTGVPLLRAQHADQGLLIPAPAHPRRRFAAEKCPILERRA